MEKIGEYLKRVRETCGYSLEDVAGITKINLRYLEAIERDDFARIPGETFCLGFIRSYAKCIGINEEEISSRIRENSKTEPPQPAHTQDKDDKKIRRAVNKQGKARIILPAVFGVLLVALLFILYSGGRDNETIRNSKEIKELTDVNALNDMNKVNDENVVPAVSNEAPPNVEEEKVEPVVLKIYARELTWISARIDDKDTKEVLLKPGEGVMWNGEDKIIITAGNAGGIDLDVNGKTLDPLGKRGEVIRDTVITSAGIKK
ncbi:MAG: helix-turn-helix domain-containing protein [Nitrospirae bacterium]|nr:helix-turn-helix domain-containing protein [Nitrospirota bacterium]